MDIGPEDQVRDALEQLEIDAYRALSGADYVRQRLLHGLSMGTPSLEAQAYLIKSRVKDAATLVWKSTERRESKPGYTPKDARDIVGLRILTLFQSELPLMLSQLMDFMSWSQRDPFSLFFGNSLRDCISEIKIYNNHDPFDPNIAFYLEEFRNYGFKKKESNKPGSEVGVEIEQKKSGYSSIHIVVWANGPQQSRSDRVPVEIQLRTSLEDAWGEMDHRLRYKNRQKAIIAYLSGGDAPRLGARDDLADEDLKILKTYLDACSRSADLIERRIKATETGQDTIRRHKKFISYDIEKLLELGLSQPIQKELEKTVSDLHSVYREVLTLREGASKRLLDDALATFERSAEDFKRCLEIYKERPLTDPERDTEARYRLLLERGLCMYWRAVLIEAGAGGKSRAGREKEVGDSLRRALFQFRLVEEETDRREDPVISFRISNVLEMQGNHDLALLKLQEAMENLKNDSFYAPNHHMRLRIPRQYAFAEWEAAERIKWTSMELGDETLLLARRRTNYLRALEVTLDLYGLDAAEGAMDRGSETLEEENRISANNIVEYACDFLLSGGSLVDIGSSGLTRRKFEAYLAEAAGEGLASIDRVSFADTVRKGARLLGDRSKAVSAAERVLALIDQQDFRIKLPDETLLEIRRNAEAELAHGLAPVVDEVQWLS